MLKRTIILLRHGKAERDGPTDHDRELADRGHEQARAVGKSLKKFFGRIDRAIVSDAKRTRQTFAELLIEVPVERLILKPELYSVNNQQEFAKALQPNLDDSEKTLLVVGHNPTISALATEYTSEEIDLGTGEYIIATLESADWQTAIESTGCWTLKYPS